MSYRTLYGDWGGSSFQGRLIAEIDDLPQITADTGSINVTIRWHVEFTANTYDTSNAFHTWGSWPDSSGVFSIPSSTKRAMNGRVQTISLNPMFGSTYGLRAIGTLTGIQNIGSSTVLSLDQWVQIPAKPYKLPLAPLDFQVSKLAPLAASMTWGSNRTDDAGPTPWVALYVDRVDNIATQWLSPLVRLPITATTYTDTTLVEDRRYQYRTITQNPAGSSTYANQSGYLYTKPARATNLVATKDAAGDITLTWDSPSTTATSWRVLHQQGSGAWDVSPLGTTSATTYTHSAPGLGASHTYSITALTPDGTAADTSTTVTVNLPGAPHPAQNLSPLGVTVDRAGVIELRWDYITADGSPQRAYEVTYRRGTAAWVSTGQVLSTERRMTFPANTFDTEMIEFQVRTWGSQPDPSVWSASAVFHTSTRPSVTITSPANGSTIITDTVSMTWVTTAAPGEEQATYTMALKSATGKLLETRAGAGTGQSAGFNTALSTGQAYTLELQVGDGDGLTSTVASVGINVAFTPPPPPVVTSVWDDATGVVSVAIENPPSPGMATTHNSVYRLNPDGSSTFLATCAAGSQVVVVDRIPHNLPTNQYRVVVYSAVGSTCESVTTVETPNRGDWFWINHGAGWVRQARARLEGAASSSYRRPRVDQAFAGHKRVTSYAGELRELTIDVSVKTEEGDPLGCRSAWIAMVDQGEIVCYRDPQGRRLFGTIRSVSFPTDGVDVSDMAFQFTEEGFDE